MKTTSTNIQQPRQDDAGYDLYVDRKVVIPPRSSELIDTDIAVQIPKGCFGHIFSRSGNSTKLKVEVGAGLVDPGFTGAIKVHLYNHSDITAVIPKGRAIAQLAIISYISPPLEIVDSLEQTERGFDGFGSTDDN